MPKSLSMLIVVGYLIAVTCIHVFDWSGWLTDVLVTPLLYLVPTGLALLLFSIGGNQIRIYSTHGRSGIIILGYILGSYVLTILFVLREKYSIEVSLLYSYTIILLFALIGWYRARRLFQSGITFRVLGYSLPVLIVVYTVNYLVFSEYPLRDVFQETHFMKGAMELSRFNILNPNTSNSYIPYAQVSNALLHHVFKYDLLRAQWITPGFIFFIYVYTFKNFFSAILPDRQASPLAILLGSVLFSDLSLSNGALALIGSVIIFTGLMRSYDTTGTVRRTLTHALVIFLVLGASLKYQHYMGPMFILIFMGIAIYGHAVKYLSRSLCFLYMVILLTLCLVYFHRGTFLFVPVVVFCYVLYSLLKWSNVSTAGKPLYLFFLGLSLFTPAVSVIMVLLIISLYFGATNIDLAAYLFNLFNWIATVTFGGALNSEALLGHGGNVALAELARTFTPIFSILMSISVVVYGISAFRRMQNMKGPLSAIELDVRYVWMWLAGCMIVAFILLGFPYAYRVRSIPLLLFVLLFTELIARQIEQEGRKRNRIVLGLLFVITAYMCVTSFMFYKSGVGQDSSSSVYQQWLTPVSTLYQVVIFILLSIAFVAYKHKAGILLLCAIIPVSVLYDKDSLRVSLMRYSYGNKVPPGISAVSHYSTLELMVADELYGFDKKSVLISDPYTLSILRARTGLDSVVTYSNLNLVNGDAEKYLRSTLQAIADAKQTTAALTKRQLCKNVFSLLNMGASELNYTFYAYNKPIYATLTEWLRDVLARKPVPNTLRNLRVDSAPNQGWVQHAFFSMNARWRLVGVFSEKTKLWAASPPILFGLHQTYYPVNGELEKELIDSVYKNFHVFRNIENKILIFDVDCRDQVQ